MARKRVLVLGDLPGAGLARLRRCCDVDLRPQRIDDEKQLAAQVSGYHGLLTLLTQPVGASVFAAGESLEIVANCAVGVDNIDLEAAARHGVVVTHTPDVLTEDTADLAWGLILALLRGIVSGDRFLRRGEFHGWEPKLLLGRSLQSITLGVVGAGRIGQAVLTRARAFGVSTLYSKRVRLAPARERELATGWCPLAELLDRSDVVTLHASLQEDSHHLLDEAALRRMRPGGYLVNTARGPLVDEAALVRLLEEGHLAGAGLDVYEHEPQVHPALLDLQNVVLLPHIGSATRETRRRMADCCFDDLITRLYRGEIPQRAVGGTPEAAGDRASATFTQASRRQHDD